VFAFRPMIVYVPNMRKVQHFLIFQTQRITKILNEEYFVVKSPAIISQPLL